MLEKEIREPREERGIPGKQARLEKPEKQEAKISRRKVLTSLGMSGLAFVAGSSMLRAVPGVSAMSVTGDVYEQADKPSVSARGTCPVLNVRDFGAVGDGETDDTAAIQNALNEAQHNHYTHVVVPRGTYKVTDTLRIYRHTRFSMEQGATLLRCHDYSFMVNGKLNASFQGYEGHGDIIIEGGVWEGNILQYPDDFNGFGLARGRNIIIRNVELRDVVSAHGVDMNACENVLIENCRFLGYRDDTPNQTRNYAEAIQIANHTKEGFSLIGVFDGTPCRNITIRNCYFGASGTPGTQAWPAGVGNHYAVHNLYNSNIKIYGNTFEGMTFAGVRSFKYTELFVTDNLFLNCNRGIMLSNPQANTESSKDADGVQSGLPQSGRNIVISGNVFKGTLSENIYGAGWPKTNAVYAKMESVIISGNLFEEGSISHNCITLRWTHNVTVANNLFRNQYRGMLLSYVSEVSISGNRFLDMKTEAVYTEEPDADYQDKGHTSGIYVGYNQIRRCGRTGIFIQSMDGFRVEGNTISSPATETDNTRSGILVANKAKNGKVAGNTVSKAPSGNQNQYGINVTGTTSNVQVADNCAEGKTAAVLVQGSSNFDGIYVHAPNGTRYKMTIGNNGAPVFTQG
ncbi:right-handed parallel beta-helix repeat-containing protein [Paenibacillus sp. J2TS4]|uniref:right-handed parallel beta-helix repeat-containing protein n=1 Tax=Paenibacillus sp. J2TS4 TaxID=2807194 RepID=UPI001B0812D6|nr:right-handed parallel beta-helix repeat-containing protein [Paenibacillus sp. J2TS4]GIP32119.1 hypothetical protein J2TS4_13290 [Paenibacillus sp. J2TS4]